MDKVVELWDEGMLGVLEDHDAVSGSPLLVKKIVNVRHC